MPTIAELKAQFDSQIRNQTTANSITTAIMANQLNALADKIGEFIGAVLTLTDAATINWDLSQGNYAKLNQPMAGNRALNITNLPVPCSGTIVIKQDATGGRLLTLPSGSQVPAGWALSTAPNAEDELGFDYDGVNFKWHMDKDYGTGTAPPPSLIDLLFPTNVSLVNDGTGIWTGSNAAGFYMNYGLSNKKLAASTDGYIQARYEAADAVNAQIAFSLLNTNKKYDAVAGEYIAGGLVSSGNLYYSVAGAVTSTGVTMAAGDYFRIIRTGSVTKLQKSVDGTTWTDAFTYATTSTADFFINMNIDRQVGLQKVYHPRGFNVI